jgi:hypothetical protein
MKQTVARPCCGRMALVAFALFAGGCGSGRPTAYPVKGMLEINGQPAAGVSVLFMPGPPGGEL